MIKTISDLLSGFINEEKRKLDEYDLNHAPTIGNMYEGLTNELLSRSIPSNIDLKIVSGFIIDNGNKMTPQIDCMLVQGSGEQIPYTKDCKWHIKDVIAVFEVKKNLYSSELRDSFSHLKEVLNSYSNYAKESLTAVESDNSSVLRTFSEISSKVITTKDDLEKCDFSQQMIYHSLVVEHSSPVRILLGYNGFKSESSLRKSLINFLFDNAPYGKGFGINSFPQLIISENFSLLKLNGQPYSYHGNGSKWIFYASSRTNPIRHILEFIWTRLEKLYGLSPLWGEDLEIECLNPLLEGEAIQQEGFQGWNYNAIEVSEKELNDRATSYEWQPVIITPKQHHVICVLCKKPFEDINNPGFVAFVESDGETVENFLKDLIKTGLVGRNSNKIQLITELCQCAFLPDGKIVAAENNSGRLTRWINKNYPANHSCT